jgi:hypothetical protein
MANFEQRMLNPVLYPAGSDVDTNTSAVTWSAVWAGSATAVAVSLVLLTLGSGFGLAASSPWPGVGPSPTTFTIAAGIWLIIMQWISSLFGGYMTGRLRTRWHGLHSHEVFFRDTAHGLLTWATATIIVAAIALLSDRLAGMLAVPVDAAMSREAADAARKAASTFAIVTGISMIVGAFIACVAAAIGGHLRDEHP